MLPRYLVLTAMMMAPLAQTPGVSAPQLTREAMTRSFSERFGMDTLQQSLLNSGYDTAESLVSPAPDGLALIGAIWIDADPDLYLHWAEQFADVDRGSSVQAVRKLSHPPARADFDTLVLSKEELRELRECRVGDCAVQLDAASIARIAAIDWRGRGAEEQATTIVRDMMFAVAVRYMTQGDSGLTSYHDSRRVTDVPAICTDLIEEEAAAGLTPVPVLNYLGGAPAAVPAGATSYLYWTTNTFGLKPTTRLNHVVVYRHRDDRMAGVIATKMLYATHYFHGGLDVRYVMAQPEEPRFLLVNITRSRSDGLTGLTGAIIGDTIRRRALEGLRKYLRYTKETVERRQRQGWTASR